MSSWLSPYNPAPWRVGPTWTPLSLRRIAPCAPCSRPRLRAGPCRSRKPRKGRTPAPAALSPDDRRESAALMRVNHAGEVAAQALYHAQALFARNPESPRIHAPCGARGNRSPRLVRDPAERARRPTQRAESALVCGIFRHRHPRRFARRPRQPGVRGRNRAAGRRPSRRVISSALPADDLRSRAIVEAMCHDEVGHGRAGAKCRGCVATGTGARIDAANGQHHDAYFVPVLMGRL